MKITITPTDMMTTIDGAPVRAWDGRTDTGMACRVFVRLIAVRDEEDTRAFNRELPARVPPAEMILPLREVLEGYGEGR